MKAKAKVINGKRRLLPAEINLPNYQERRPFERDVDLLAYRNFVLKAFHYDKKIDYKPIAQEIRRIWSCPLGCCAAGKPTKFLFPCGSLICPHCRQFKIDELPVTMLGRLRRHDVHGYTLLTLKMKPIPISSSYQDKSGLRLAVNSIKRLLEDFRRQVTRVNGIALRGGTYGIHTFWDQAPENWDIHLHVIVVGTFTALERRTMRMIWKTISGRRDKHAFHHRRITHNLWRIAAYIIPGIVSTFFDRTVPTRRLEKMRRAYAESALHPAVVAEWLDMARPVPGTSLKRENRLVGSWGCLRG